MLTSSFPMVVEATTPPMFDRLCVLLVEDSDNDALILTKRLEKECVRFRSVRVQNAEEMRASLEAEIFDAILCDHDMPEFSAMGALDVRNALDCDVPFIIVTGAIGGEEVAVELMRRGVADFVTKDKLGRLLPALRRELEEAAVRQAKRDAEEALRRKNAELEEAVERLTRTQAELVRAGRMKGLGRMAAGISHAMNNALGRVAGLLECSSQGSKDADDRIQKVRDAVEDAAKIVKRLTYFCDVHPRERGGVAVDLNQALADGLAACSERLEGREGGVRIDTLTNFRDLPPVLGDPDQFRDAITTLILNACGAMPEGGALKLSSYRNTGGVVVEIEDDGVGMSPELLRQNLEPFFDDYSGDIPDMGYAWINALMERYGGILRAESAEGLGTKVHLRFPICETSTDAVGGEDAPVAGRRLKVLVVDDERVIAECLGSFFADGGHEVTVAYSGYEALNLVREHSFDLVVSDRVMKDFSGDELAARLRESGGSEKFILATGSGDLLIASCQKLKGVDVILPKPVSREALRRAVEESGVYLPA